MKTIILFLLLTGVAGAEVIVQYKYLGDNATGFIEGEVYHLDNESKKAEGLELELCRISCSDCFIVAQAYTNSAGQFQFPGLIDKKYQVMPVNWEGKYKETEPEAYIIIFKKGVKP